MTVLTYQHIIGFKKKTNLAILHLVYNRKFFLVYISIIINVNLFWYFRLCFFSKTHTLREVKFHIFEPNPQLSAVYSVTYILPKYLKCFPMHVTNYIKIKRKTNKYLINTRFHLCEGLIRNIYTLKSTK